MRKTETLEQQLNSFDAQERREALETLCHLANSGEISIEPAKEIANMHCHTFFSFNGYGMSPSALAWMAKRDGIKLLGIVDFDTLDAVEEFLEACAFLGVRGSAGMETRVFIPQFSDREINSPGEPGISYHMGIGFTKKELPPVGQNIMSELRQRVDQRNRGMVERLNSYLSPLVLDYEKDVLPLTPAGNATERHMLTALVNSAEEHFEDPSAFWAQKLSMSQEKITALYKSLPQLKNEIRKKLMKRGGIGYVQPGPDTFPVVDDVHTLILSGEALPCITWLDGTSEGEQAIEELFNLLISKGAAALNIVPDRNWNIDDPQAKAIKVKKLYEVVAFAQKYDLPLNIGTELNAYGQKLIDSFDAEELEPVKDAFLDGAYFIYGHTIMERYAGLGYQSNWATKHFKSRTEKNNFYISIGRKIEPQEAGDLLVHLSSEISPMELLASLE
jgi:hypothetical protein